MMDDCKHDRRPISMRILNLQVLALTFAFLLTGRPAVVSAKTLVVGDSHTCGAFGNNLGRQLATKDDVVIYCTDSSSAGDWLNARNPDGKLCRRLTFTADAAAKDGIKSTEKLCGSDGKVPSFASVVKKEKADRIVIALGTNSLEDGVADDNYSKLAQLAKDNSAGCDWIGPPHVKADEVTDMVLNPKTNKLEKVVYFSATKVKKMEAGLAGFYRSLSEKVSGPCRLHDSSKVTRYLKSGRTTSDGVHRGRKGGKAWATEVAKMLLTSDQGQDQQGLE